MRDPADSVEKEEEGSESPWLAPGQTYHFFSFFGLPPTRRLLPSLFS